MRVKAGVHYPGISLACADRNVVSALKHGYLRVESRQLARYGAADYAASDYNDFRHYMTSLTL